MIRDVRADHYLIPLPTALSDSTHGTIRGFELVTVRLRDDDGVEGVGYTYTVGAGGAAVHALLARDLVPVLAGRNAGRIEALWQTMWWALHYLEAHGFGLDRFIADPLRLEDGRAIAPDRPGHGIELDWKALDAVRA